MPEDENGKRPLTRAEKFKNYCFGIGALSALLLGIWANVKGEPVAEKTWETLRTQLNYVSDTANKLQLRMTYFQARQELQTAMEIQQKLDALQKKYDAVTGKAPNPILPKPVMKLTVKPPSACPKGQVRDSAEKCRHVHRAVASKVLKTEKRAEALGKALVLERQKSKDLERGKSDLMRKYIQQSKAPPPPAPKPIKALPDKLDEARK